MKSINKKLDNELPALEAELRSLLRRGAAIAIRLDSRHAKRTRDGAQIAAEPRREYSKRK